MPYAYKVVFVRTIKQSRSTAQAYIDLPTARGESNPLPTIYIPLLENRPVHCDIRSFSAPLSDTLVDGRTPKDCPHPLCHTSRHHTPQTQFWQKQSDKPRTALTITRLHIPKPKCIPRIGVVGGPAVTVIADNHGVSVFQTTTSFMLSYSDIRSLWFAKHAGQCFQKSAFFSESLTAIAMVNAPILMYVFAENCFVFFRNRLVSTCNNTV